MRKGSSLICWGWVGGPCLLGRPRRRDAGIRGLGSQRGVWMLKEQGWELSQQGKTAEICPPGRAIYHLSRELRWEEVTSHKREQSTDLIKD